MEKESPLKPGEPGREPRACREGFALGSSGGKPVCQYAEGSEEASQFRSGWRRGYQRWESIDRRYRFGAP